MKPENIHCLAFNFPGVSLETSHNEPLYFIKSSSSYSKSGVAIKKPGGASRFWTEVELGIFIKKDCENVPESDVKKYIHGYCVSGDLTCDNIYNRDHHLAYSKSRENFCPCSDIIKTDIDDFNLRMNTVINGKETQSGNLQDMIYSAYKSISYISSITKLKKNDLIILGTPPGWNNNILYSGDEIVQTIEKIGSLHYSII